MKQTRHGSINRIAQMWTISIAITNSKDSQLGSDRVSILASDKIFDESFLKSL